ncbi:MAG: hypothetical protein ACYC55_04755 [Candidatus Geothermincolia bacterium]
MVEKRAILRRRLGAAIALCLLMLLPLAVPVQAAPGAASSYDVVEEITIELDAVGNGRYIDIIVYDDEFFEAAAEFFNEYPYVLSRRFRQESDIAEIENFEVDINERRATITVTYDMPGMAYYNGDEWMLYGYPEPFSQTGLEMEFETEGPGTSEFTLWEELSFLVTTKIVAPVGASDLRYDKNNYAVAYRLPLTAAAAGEGTILQRNKVAFTTVFGIILLACAYLAVMLLNDLRRARRAPETLPPPPMPPMPPLP